MKIQIDTDTKHRLQQKEPHILTLIIMSSFASMGAIVFTPALPEISAHFKISQNYSQLAVTLFLVGYSLGQLLYGPLSNYLGRKKAFFIGVVIATIGTIASIVSDPLDSFPLLLLGRVLEALGSSAGLVVAYTIVNDYYFPEYARRITSYMTLAFAITPGVALLIGGTLVTYFHWLSCFYFLLVYGLLVAIPVYHLAETATEFDKNAIKIKHVKINYVKVFENKLLRNTSFFFALHSMCIYAYATTAPFIAINTLHITPEKFGVLGLIPYTGTALASFLSSRLIPILSGKRLIQIGLVFESLSILMLSFFFYLGDVSLFVLLACAFVLMFGGAIIVSNAIPMAAAEVEDKANASAVMNFINVGMPVCGTLLLALFPGSAELKLCAVLLGALVLMLVMCKKLNLHR